MISSMDDTVCGCTMGISPGLIVMARYVAGYRVTHPESELTEEPASKKIAWVGSMLLLLLLLLLSIRFWFKAALRRCPV